MALETTINQRVKRFFESKKISQKLFSEVTGYDEKSISNIVNDKTQYPKADFFQAFAIHYPEINLRWLLIGEGEMEGEPGAFPVVAMEPQERASYKPAQVKSVEQLAEANANLVGMLKDCMEEKERLRKGEK